MSKRVMAGLYDIHTLTGPPPSRESNATCQEVLTPSQPPGDLAPKAVMDLGATSGTPKSPPPCGMPPWRESLPCPPQRQRSSPSCQRDAPRKKPTDPAMVPFNLGQRADGAWLLEKRAPTKDCWAVCSAGPANRSLESTNSDKRAPSGTTPLLPRRRLARALLAGEVPPYLYSFPPDADRLHAPYRAKRIPKRAGNFVARARLPPRICPR